MNFSNSNPPRLYDTGRGFSVLYKDKYLYSRYNPPATVQKTVELLDLQSGTLVLCNSPLLGYGISRLLERLPHRCAVLAIEFDPLLFEFSLCHISQNSIDDKRFMYCNPKQPQDVCQLIDQNRSSYLAQFRRCIAIDCSGGTEEFKEKYQETYRLVQDQITTFWKNRMTLIRLGKLYAKNIIRNMALIQESISFPSQLIEKPIIVLGAGPSLEFSATFIKANRQSLFVLAVESAVPAMADMAIYPDAIIAVESQLANGKAFIGSSEIQKLSELAHGSQPIFFADISSRTNINRLFCGRICFFASKYTTEQFFTDVVTAMNLHCIQPLGSVGLAAIQIALDISKPDTPVFITGLDFSFSNSGETHAHGTPQNKRQLYSVNRILPPGNPASIFVHGVTSVQGKNRTIVYTDPSLQLYARLASACFTGYNRLYDIGITGTPLTIPLLQESEATKRITCTTIGKEPFNLLVTSAKPKIIQVISWINGEIENLTKISLLLSSGGNTDEIRSLMHKSSYLYLHFPDGENDPQNNLSFYKRVKAEIVFFIKQLTLTAAELSKRENTVQ